MTKDEALRMALDALEMYREYTTDGNGVAEQAITAIKEALAQPEQKPDRTGMVYYKNNLCKAKDAHSHDCICWTKAQPEQEPVAWMSHNKENFVSADDVGNSVPNWTDYYPTPLYITPPPCPTCEALARTVMLDQTYHDNISPQRKPLTDEEIRAIDTSAFWNDHTALDFARAIEAAHGIKE